MTLRQLTPGASFAVAYTGRRGRLLRLTPGAAVVQWSDGRGSTRTITYHDENGEECSKVIACTPPTEYVSTGTEVEL